MLHAAFHTIIITLTKNDTALKYVLMAKKQKLCVVDMNLCVSTAIWIPLTTHFLSSSERVLREMFVISHQAHGASSKPVCELKCSSINFLTVYSLVKKNAVLVRDG